MPRQSLESTNAAIRAAIVEGIHKSGLMVQSSMALPPDVPGQVVNVLGLDRPIILQPGDILVVAVDGNGSRTFLLGDSDPSFADLT